MERRGEGDRWEQVSTSQKSRGGTSASTVDGPCPPLCDVLTSYTDGGPMPSRLPPSTTLDRAQLDPGQLQSRDSFHPLRDAVNTRLRKNKDMPAPAGHAAEKRREEKQLSPAVPCDTRDTRERTMAIARPCRSKIGCIFLAHSTSNLWNTKSADAWRNMSCPTDTYVGHM